MFTRDDIAPLSIAAASAVCSGFAFGAWAAPPAPQSVPVAYGEVQPIYGDDPNLARYKAVIAEQGGPGPLYLVTGYPSLAPALPSPEESAAAEAEVDREVAAFEAQNRAWEAERSARLQAAQAQWTPPALPAAYIQAEQVTAAEAQTDAVANSALSPG